MTIVDDFDRELRESGTVKPETLSALADYLRSKPKTGAPKKTLRDLEASCWYHIAIDVARYKSNVAYAQLALRLNVDERTARRIVKNVKAIDHMVFSWKAETGKHVAICILANFREIPAVSCFYNGNKFTTLQTQRYYEGKNAHFFIFDKSDF